MPREQMTSKTGNAQINRQGHTASNKFGSDPNYKGKMASKPRDLKVK